MEEEYIFDCDGSIDVEAMREERQTRKVPANPPPGPVSGSDGKKESNAYHIGWIPLIAVVRDRYHFKPKTKHAAAAILRHLTDAKQEQIVSVQTRGTNLSTKLS